ncbi:MAG: sulfatase [Pseudonocardiales bacterium]|nr:sulfatase [Pseudonocardiales bacterium]
MSGPPEARAGRGRHVGRVLTAAAAALVLVALVLPGAAPTPAALLRLPVDALAGVVLLVLLPARPRRVTALVLGALLGVLAVLALLDLGFRAVLDRPFDPVVDAVLLADAQRFLAGSLGPGAATALAVAAALLALALPVGTALAALRLGRVVAGHRTAALRAVAALTPVWLACALAGAQLVPGVPVATAGASVLAAGTAVGVPASLRDAGEFAARLEVDPFADTPGAELLTALRGKDVVIAFVESYGRDAVQDPEFAGVQAVLADGTRRLDAAGYGSRSGFLTAPVAGGNSWLAHSTFLSGLRVDDQQRYRILTGSDRRTLTSAFGAAGWETVAVMPGTTGAWPEAAFYGYDRVIDHAALAYRGPDLGWATVPDQYTLSAFDRLARDGDAPLMAELALVSSHAPWGFVPPVLDWAAIGDGAVYGPLAPAGDPDEVWTRGTDAVRAAYGRAIGYSLASLVSWVEARGDDDLVLLVLGDHQPLPVVTGEGATRDVPISVVTRDPAVLDRIAGWGWETGLRPSPGAPVQPMEDFRDRFLTAFGPREQPA